jgi:hypothetical protein
MAGDLVFFIFVFDCQPILGLQELDVLLSLSPVASFFKTTEVFGRRTAEPRAFSCSKTLSTAALCLCGSNLPAAPR